MITTTPLFEQAIEFRRTAARRVPGRLAELIDRRVAVLLDLRDDPRTEPDDQPAASPPAELSDAEAVVIDLVEQFLIDVHGISDERFARLGEFYAPDEQVAIMFHLALADGFTKLDKVAGGLPTSSDGGHPTDAPKAPKAPNGEPS